ncbi:MAG: histidine kinase [Rickettsiales bacterium]|nr:histidine kinase [Rickettsiales bacterium]
MKRSSHMHTSEDTTSPPLTVALIYTAIGVSLLGVFLADSLTPLGVAVWVVYLVPLTLALLVWRPIVPIAVAALATAFIIINFFTDAEGMQPGMAQLNRGMGLVSLWVMAAVGYFFIRNKLRVRDQEWLQRGQVQLSEEINGEQNFRELGDNVLSFICDYVQAQAAVIYMQNNGGFERIATFGVPKDAAPEQFAATDGLLAQAMKNKKAFHLTDIPDGYLAVGSAFGQTKPRHLIVMPALADGRVNAVLELGFMHKVDGNVQEFLNRIADAIGIAIRSANYRVNLQNYLEETQRQSEELQTQSEELRVSNEELEEQSRALQESQSSLELQQAELEQTNSQLEEQTQLLESQRDELSRAKEELQQRAKELEQASQYKSDFLANMSHELRTPLNSTLILAKLLSDNPEENLTEEQVGYATTIYSSGNDLLELINDILDLSKIEAGHIEIQPATTSLKQVSDTLSRLFAPLADQKEITFSTEISADCPPAIFTDSKRLEQILKNLLSNALKFTAQGEVALRFDRHDKCGIAISVTDSGIGIPKAQHEAIFEAFRQADSTTNRKYGGTGLGLSITRQLARLLGGTIELESEPGKGSCFTVVLPETYHAEAISHEPIPSVQALPAAPVPSETPIAYSKPERPTSHVQDDRDHINAGDKVLLVVEDDESFARIMYDLARELDFRCLLAHQADEALILAQQYLPHAVLLDIGLPDHSGLTVLDRLKQDARTRHIPVHIVSGTDQMQTALSLGAVGYLLKPVKREELMHTLQQLETRLVQGMRRVLLVEDDKVQQASMTKLLQTGEVGAVAVGTAAECLDLLKDQTFDCMVLDLSLPDASGFSLLETLSNEDAYSFPPVIVYTGRDLSAKEEEQLRRYSRSIIIKGAKSPERLLDEVTLFLHQVVADLPAEHQRMLKKARNRDTILEDRHILVVEDDIRNVYAVTSIFEPRGASIQIARNGLEALLALEKSRNDTNTRNIDLVLMDVMMPEMDGITATREIRKDKHWEDLPIIMLTAKAMKGDQERCLAAGANDYMAKPLDVEKLLSLVRVWMPR